MGDSRKLETEGQEEKGKVKPDEVLRRMLMDGCGLQLVETGAHCEIQFGVLRVSGQHRLSRTPLIAFPFATSRAPRRRG